MPENTNLKNAEAFMQPKADKKNEISINIPIKASISSPTDHKEINQQFLRAPPPPSRGPDKLKL
jgi:hypothetical protein